MNWKQIPNCLQLSIIKRDILKGLSFSILTKIYNINEMIFESKFENRFDYLSELIYICQGHYHKNRKSKFKGIFLSSNSFFFL